LARSRGTNAGVPRQKKSQKTRRMTVKEKALKLRPEDGRGGTGYTEEGGRRQTAACVKMRRETIRINLPQKPCRAAAGVGYGKKGATKRVYKKTVVVEKSQKNWENATWSDALIGGRCRRGRGQKKKRKTSFRITLNGLCKKWGADTRQKNSAGLSAYPQK